MKSRPASLRSDTSGATIVEFALIAPVLLMMMMGVFDLGYNMYANAMLQGAIQEAARNSTIEGANTAELDAIVEEAVQDVVPGANLEFSRRNYASFSAVGQPEDWTDLNGDGRCNDGEPFEDANDNKAWDEDRGRSGQGGARDAVLYEVEVTYPRAFPIASFAGLSPEYRTGSAVVLRNQPFSLQPERAQIGNCP